MKTIINNEIELECPENFHIMDEEEMEKYFSVSRNRKGFRNAEKHMMISVGWTDPLNLLTSLMINPKAFLDGYDKRSKRALKNYKRGEDISKEICGMTAKGFAYSYEASDTGALQKGNIVAIKLQKRIYIAEYTTSSDDMTFCTEAFDMVLRSIQTVGGE